QLAALSAAFANGGTLYYLQYPHSQEEVENFTPRVKRELNIGPILPEIREGLLAAVLYGTGKSSFDRGGDEMPLGKTGTCDDHTTPSKIGWFLTYADDAHPKIALAVLLRGNTRRVKGPSRRCCRANLPQAPRAELFCQCRARRGHQYWQLTQQIGFPTLRKASAAFLFASIKISCLHQ